MFNFICEHPLRNIPNASNCKGISKFRNIDLHFRHHSIPFTTSSIDSPLDLNKLNLYVIEPLDVFDIMNPLDTSNGFMKYIPNSVIQNIKNPTSKYFLLIYFPAEGFCLSIHNNSIPEYINLICKEYDIPPDKILFVYGDINIRKTCSHSNLPHYIPTENLFGLNIFEHVSVGDYYNQNKVNIEDILLKKSKNPDRSKLFLLKNGVTRPHRMFLITKLLDLGILDKGFYSWIDHTNLPLIESDFERIFGHYYSSIQEQTKLIKLFKESIHCNKPIVLDKSPNELQDRTSQIQLNNKFLLDSYFSIVTETVVDNENTGIKFYTEKTYQPIQSLHPFILYSGYHSLKYLKNQGYATFPELFNEEYDNIKNENIRGKFIVSEVDRLSKWSKSKLNDVIYSDYVIDKLKHNQKLIDTQPAKNGFYQLMNWLEGIYHSKI